jgi:hypothetical protein
MEGRGKTNTEEEGKDEAVGGSLAEVGINATKLW